MREAPAQKEKLLGDVLHSDGGQSSGSVSGWLGFGSHITCLLKCPDFGAKFLPPAEVH